MRAVVTGSSGFIGSALTQKLLDQGWEVLGIDSHSDFYSISLKEFRLRQLEKYGRFNFIKMDVSDKTELTKLLSNEKPEVVFHLAAQAGVRIPTNQIEKYVLSNLVGFSTVLQVCVTQGVPNLLFASSSSVYGDQAKIPYTESETRLKPNSFYGATKLANEILAQTLATNSKTRIRGMRFFTVYGPMGRPDMAYFRIISSLLNNTKFELYGDGTIERDFTYIDDCVEMIIKLESELSSREVGFSDVVNVGGGHPVSINELIRLATEKLEMRLDLKQVNSNPNDAARTMADATYLQEIVGIKPETSLKTGIGLTIDWASTKVKPSQLLEWVNSSS